MWEAMQTRLKKITRPSTTLEERIPTPVMIMMKGTLHQLAHGKVISYAKNNTDKKSAVKDITDRENFASPPQREPRVSATK